MAKRKPSWAAEEEVTPEEEVATEAPVQEEPQPEAAPAKEKQPELASVLNSLTDSLTRLNHRMDAIETRVTEVNPGGRAAPSNENRGPAFPLTGGENDVIISTVQNILGEDFGVYVEPKTKGINFRVVITPPDYLKEHKDDVRVAVVPYIEGVSGVETYAKKVRDFCRNWADRQGIRWQPPILS